MSDGTETLGDWLDRELATVPQELAVRIRTALPSNARDADMASGSAIFTETAVAELRALLERGCETRRSAPALLMIDALVTYACELLGHGGADIDERSVAMLDAIAATMNQNHTPA